MFIFEDEGNVISSENLSLEMEATHPGVLNALQQYCEDHKMSVSSHFKVNDFVFDDITFNADIMYYDPFSDGRKFWQYMEDECGWYSFDEAAPGTILADVPMQVEAKAVGNVYGYRATWTGRSWVFDDFDPAGGAPQVIRFRLWDTK